MANIRLIFVDDLNCFLENEWNNFFFDIVSSVFEANTATFKDRFENVKRLWAEIIDQDLDKPLCCIIFKVNSCCTEKRQGNRIQVD